MAPRKSNADNKALLAAIRENSKLQKEVIKISKKSIQVGEKSIKVGEEGIRVGKNVIDSTKKYAKNMDKLQTATADLGFQLAAYSTAVSASSSYQASPSSRTKRGRQVRPKPYTRTPRTGTTRQQQQQQQQQQQHHQQQPDNEAVDFTNPEEAYLSVESLANVYIPQFPHNAPWLTFNGQPVLLNQVRIRINAPSTADHKEAVALLRDIQEPGQSDVPKHLYPRVGKVFRDDIVFYGLQKKKKFYYAQFGMKQ
ncbi:hypothetical protein HDV00_010455 [Rhizophlyctis rosea]|nr:hypothetical protein HDV00_010455 [Rhizophlyctis rosea]